MCAMSKGQIEAKVSEAVSRFEIEYMGRGPKQIRTMIIQDMIIIRIKGFLSPSEQKLAENGQGRDLIRQMRSMLFETARDQLSVTISQITGSALTGLYSDINMTNGEKIIVATAADNLEAADISDNSR
ncbi:MAG: DUF2294 domain-containing protein [Eubacteriales bacterium]|nr:DUF2294 domain-containing protein [Eubacteriales bacterium]MDD3198606.1 DUF2294 domain-containing protein [Eubacteriales bacterium]MDD3504498.1 DUF2294 domain-containing protein [Eubacteriales bacterium]MDD4683562.1 DUF2294 domain-containing protein [Eubacteriales bacterium]